MYGLYSARGTASREQVFWEGGQPGRRRPREHGRPRARLLSVTERTAPAKDLRVEAVGLVERELVVAGLHAPTHAHAISVRRAQGAEVPAVVVPLLTGHAAVLGRTLLDTAVTRARQLVVIVGQPRALAMAVKDWRRAARHTALDGLLDGSLRFAWRGQTAAPGEEAAPGGEGWEGLLGASPGA